MLKSRNPLLLKRTLPSGHRNAQKPKKHWDKRAYDTNGLCAGRSRCGETDTLRGRHPNRKLVRSAPVGHALQRAVEREGDQAARQRGRLRLGLVLEEQLPLPRHHLLCTGHAELSSYRCKLNMLKTVAVSHDPMYTMARFALTPLLQVCQHSLHTASSTSPCLQVNFCSRTGYCPLF